MTEQHVRYCFDCLMEHFKGQPINDPSFPNEKKALFVTWHKKKGHELELRGCIGNFSPMELHSALKQYALLSALKDSRFSPITLNELNDLCCTVSLLDDFEQGQDSMDWEIGIHGIQIHLSYQQASYSATFLPEVAIEQGWTKEQTLEALIKKSGFKGKISPFIFQHLQLTRYKTKKYQLSFQELNS